MISLWGFVKKNLKGNILHAVVNACLFVFSVAKNNPKLAVPPNPFLTQFLPTILLWGFAAILPAVVSWSSYFEAHWTRLLDLCIIYNFQNSSFLLQFQQYTRKSYLIPIGWEQCSSSVTPVQKQWCKLHIVILDYDFLKGNGKFAMLMISSKVKKFCTETEESFLKSKKIASRKKLSVFRIFACLFYK